MNIEKILSEMTLEEKASLCSGSDFWHTKALPRFDIEPMMLSDGPHGIRKTNREHTFTWMDAAPAKAVCFPAACATASSFDKALLEKMGKAIGDGCQAEDIAVLLGPGINIKRTPLCGRNFEYFSEDPYLAANQAIALINGVQSKGVGTSVKHFACNNQETRRMAVSANIDERTLFEIYLTAFEEVCTKAKPWTVMASYNRLNGTYTTQNKFLLKDVLRDKWGYEGLVMSDWGAVDEREKGVEATLDLQMPACHGKTDAIIVEKVRSGELDEKCVDACARRVLELYDKYKTNHVGGEYDPKEHHRLAREISAQCAVLLKNDDKLLPLDGKKKIAFVGAFAKNPRFQGGGSSHIDNTEVTSALDAVSEYTDVAFALGFEAESEKPDEALISEAVEVAKASDVVVIFAGLPESFEFEGGDRKHMDMPQCQNELIDRICEVNENVAIVLHNGSPFMMPWRNKVKAILEMYLGGQAVGGATCDLLFGKENPSGKLPETFPLRHCDTPAYLNEFGVGDNVDYTEGIFVGYRWYDKREMDVMFPFGFGLSYTEFEYSDITVSANEIKDTETVTVGVTIKNIGDCFGREAVQLYVSDPECSVPRPVKELFGYEKVALQPGESKKVFFRLDKRAFSYYNTQIHDWYVEDGRFDILIGSSSRDIRLTTSVYVSSTVHIPVKYTINNIIGDVTSFEEGKKILLDFIHSTAVHENKVPKEILEGLEPERAYTMFDDLSLRTTIDFIITDGITRESLQACLDKISDLANSDPDSLSHRTESFLQHHD
ncbi:MAG: glycoside hydrolase family 3 C-terminal domain-containing protein [Oscillospiraceae bacterium]|nr:glycoside hydrolase family 3 C-terminal domain-containing protein [Oscillospiraceae bacterium]